MHRDIPSGMAWKLVISYKSYFCKALGTCVAQGDGEAALKKLQTSLRELSDIVETKDKEKVFNQNAVCLNLIGDVEQAMVKGFPFSVPKEYDNLPQLKVKP